MENFINKEKIIREETTALNPLDVEIFLNTNIFIETLPNGVRHFEAYNKEGTLRNTQNIWLLKITFLMGDNRDCSKDSRFYDVGYVKRINLVGKAKIIFFSNDTNKSSLLKFWNLNNSFRFERTFKGLK